MNWEEKLKYTLKDSAQSQYEHIYKICLNAYLEGCSNEKERAIEAHRLQCGNLFGNKCMIPSLSIPKHIKICDGECSYIQNYKFELFKLED